MGFLILIGVLVLVLVRQSMGRRKQLEEDRQEIQEGTERLKAELEKTGNEIIERIEDHVVKIEALMKESDQASRALDRRITELQNTLSRGARMREDLGEVQQELEQMRLDLEQESTKAQRIINVSRRAAASMSSIGVPSQIVVAPNNVPTPSYQLPPSQPQFSTPISQSAPQPALNVTLGQVSDSQNSRQDRQESKPIDVEPIEEIDRKPIQNPKTDAAAFAEVLKSSMDRAESANESEDLTKELSATKDSSDRARELLQSGWSVEEVAKETGMGRSALELMQKMSPSK